MTRETKIGLLVGLAFIIVIGILLSDHLTNSGDPQAQLTLVGPNALQGLSVPGGNSAQVPAPVNPPAITPREPVPTRIEVTRPPTTAPAALVRIGPGPAVPVEIRGSTPPAPVEETRVATNHTGDSGMTAGADAPDVRGPLGEIASRHGEELVAVGTIRTPTGPAAPAVRAGKQYKAETGDTVSKMAAKFLGGNTKTNRDAIVKANPTLQADPNKVIVGATYAIPTPVAIEQPRPVIAPPAVAPAPAPAVASSMEHWYTVKANDSLWKIASEQMGDAAAVASIKELNRDVLKGTDIVKPNMKLRLPAKPVASIQ